jgi:hypothetical protein
MAANKHVENLERLRARLRRERRDLAETVATGAGLGRRDLLEFGELQRSFEAVTDAIKDENNEAAAEAARIRPANQPEPQRYDTESLDHDIGPK